MDGAPPPKPPAGTSARHSSNEPLCVPSTPPNRTSVTDRPSSSTPPGCAPAAAEVRRATALEQPPSALGTNTTRSPRFSRWLPEKVTW
eukprot:5058105-Prymnesium_polylepis.1